MASIKLEGLTEYQKQLESLDTSITGLLKRGVYDGAAVVANAVRASISALPAIRDEDAMGAYRSNSKTALSESEKKGLLNGLGLSEMRESGSSVNTKLSFHGYNAVKTKKFPQGQPNLMIAASVESGTSARRKQPFLRPTVNRVKNRATAAMEETVTSDIEKIMGGK